MRERIIVEATLAALDEPALEAGTSGEAGATSQTISRRGPHAIPLGAALRMLERGSSNPQSLAKAEASIDWPGKRRRIAELWLTHLSRLPEIIDPDWNWLPVASNNGPDGVLSPETQLAREGQEWHRWGPYLSERSWGTVREDYSRKGAAWNFLTHDMARSKAYRWGDDGLAGGRDRFQDLGFSLKEIKELLALRVDPEQSAQQVKALAEEKLSQIDAKIASLQAMKVALADLVAACPGSEGNMAHCPIIQCFESPTLSCC